LFGFPCRTRAFSKNRETLREFAIGWTDAERVPCREKENEAAVMFLVREREFWFHMRRNEFENAFAEPSAV
jgi:hypothetical protein